MSLSLSLCAALARRLIVERELRLGRHFRCEACISAEMAYTLATCQSSIQIQPTPRVPQQFNIDNSRCSPVSGCGEFEPKLYCGGQLADQFGASRRISVKLEQITSRNCSESCLLDGLHERRSYRVSLAFLVPPATSTVRVKARISNEALEMYDEI